MNDRAQAVGLFRYSLIRQAADEALSGRERGALVRRLAAETHLGSHGERVRVSRNTLDRWIRSYRSGGFAALVPEPRHVDPRTPIELLELAEALRVEEPMRTAAQIARVIAEAKGYSPSPRTIQRHLARAGLPWRGEGSRRIFGRFEAEQPNELWIGDALHGPAIAGRKTYLFAFIDDHSRALVGYRWGHAEDTLRLEAALRAGMAARGVPRRIYLDNGSAMVSHQLLRVCACLGVVLVHSRPGMPQGRGKIERVFRTVNEQFVVELSHSSIDSIDALNRVFAAWVESIYHRAVHGETGMAPLERFLAGGPPRLASAEQLHEAFLWSEQRRVAAKTATVTLFGNHYEVDTMLAGQKVELVFDPFELSEIEVRFEGRPMGKAIPRRIERHSHPKARPEPSASTPRPTGIDYLRLIERRREAELTSRIEYRSLKDDETDKARRDGEVADR
jgi:putative transposase